MALPIRSYPPNQRGLTLVRARSNREETPASGESRRYDGREPLARESLTLEPSSSPEPSSSHEPSSPEPSSPEQGEAKEPKSEARVLSTFVAEGAPSGPAGDTRSGPLPSRDSAPISIRSSRPDQVSDGELVALARVGETAAFEGLYRRYASYAFSLAVRVQGHSGDIEDIVHDAFLKVHDRLAELRADDSFRPWLSAIVVSLVRSRLRKRRMLSLLGLSQSEPIELDALVTTEAGPDVRAQLAQVYAVLGEVPVDQRICWTLRYLEGRKLEEVAQVAGIALATAKRKIAAVQERLASLEGERS